MDNKLKTISHIIEGHLNNTLDKVGMLPEDTKALGDIRFEKCERCDTTPHPASPPSPEGEGKRSDVFFGPGLRAGRFCNSCGCDMQAKTKVVDAKCPIGRW